MSVAALRTLQARGTAVYPDPAALAIIQDKGAQKAFYQAHGLPTADYRLADDRAGLALDNARLLAETRAALIGLEHANAALREQSKDTELAVLAQALRDGVPVQSLDQDHPFLL